MESSLPHLPDLVVDKIIQLLPTKLVFQTCIFSNRWRGIVLSSPTLDFDEFDHFDRYDLPSQRKHNLKLLAQIPHFIRHHRYLESHDYHLHLKFLNSLQNYLLLRNQFAPLDKLRLRIRMVPFEQRDIIHEVVQYACKRNLKELDVSMDFQIEPYLTATDHLVETKRPLEPEFYRDYYQFPLRFLPSSGKSLTCLKLGCVKIIKLELPHAILHGRPHFPCLKTISCKAVRFVGNKAPHMFLSECPSLERLSLSYCSFENHKLNVCYPSLKYLEVKYCHVDDIRVDQASNLESFSFFSLKDSGCKTMILKGACNLKHVDVSVKKNIGEFSLVGCHRALEASIMSERINKFEFFDGSSCVKLSIEFEDDDATINQTTILDEELMNEVGFSSEFRKYVPRLVSFSESFGCCKITSQCNEGVQTLTMLKPNRRTIWSAPSSTLRKYGKKRSAFDVRIPLFRIMMSKNDDLLETLRRIAPCAKLLGRTTTIVDVN